MIQQSGQTWENKIRWWQGASLWPDGSSERGFVVAIDKDSEEILQKGSEWVVKLATKYNQGAVYRYHYDIFQKHDGDEETGRLMRETIAVLDPGTDAMVEVIRDDAIDLSSLLDK